MRSSRPGVASSSEFESRSLLRDGNFRRVYVATAVSAVGVAVAGLAIPLMAIRSLHASDSEVGWVSACLTLPFFVIGLPAGAWVDRWDRRRVLVSCQALRGLVMLAVPSLWWLGLLSLVHLFMVVAVFGALNVFHVVADQSFLPELVAGDRLVEANGHIEGMRQVIRLGGPALAGLLIAAVSAPGSLVATGLALALSSITFWRIRRGAPPRRRPPAGAPETEGGLRKQIATGVKVVVGSRILRTVAASSNLSNLFNYAGYTASMLFMARTLDLSAGVIGLYAAISGVGGLVGARVARRISDRFGMVSGMVLCLGTTAPFAIALPLCGASWTLAIGSAGSAVAGAGAVAFNVLQVSYIQRETPEHLLSRVAATMRFLTWGLMPLGAVLGGYLASGAGPRVALVLMVVGSCVAVGPLLALLVRRDEGSGADQDAESAARG
jgi:MFS family permease